MKKKFLSTSIAGVLGTAFIASFPTLALAQSDESVDTGARNEVEEVRVTGSIIRRSEANSALPVQIMTAEDIAQTGVSNAQELMAKIPAIQNSFHPSDSVGGGGGGIATANLRGIGSAYTLVLLNGRRLAPADSGSVIDLSNIPISAIERVDVLTDGASATYGSDAIAGVVNFILKNEVETTTVSVRTDRPQESGGESFQFDVTTGFGNFDADGFNVMLSFSHDQQDRLAAADREFAETGIITFDHPDYERDALFFNGSGNSIPGNARVRYLEDGTGEEVELIFNPYRQRNDGNCPEQTSPIDTECWFDYTSTIEILPEYERNSVVGNVDFRITDDIKGFVNAIYSTHELTARIASYPTGYVRLYNSETSTSVPQLVQDEIVTLLAAAPAEGGFGLSATEVDNLTVVDGRWRALPAGNRTTEYVTDSINLVTGLEGAAGEVEYSAALTYAVTETEQNYPTGWLYRDAFSEAASNGAFNIFAGQEEFTEADAAALAPTIYSGNWDTTKVSMTALNADASMPLFSLGGGDAIGAVGLDYRITNYERSIAPANANEELLFVTPDTPYDMERTQYGIFTEVLMPFASNFELTGSLRYDNNGAVEDKLTGEDISESDSDVTYKLNALWNITDMVSARASYGTGFKAPDMREIGEPQSDFGVTSGNYTCPFTDPDPLAALCLPGENQLQVYRQGNPDLKSEKSTQYTFGFVIDPIDSLNIIVDYWNIELEDLVDRKTEQEIILNPEENRQWFTSRLNLATNEEELAIIQAAENVAEAEYSGVDYKFVYTYDAGFGSIQSTFGGTYMIDSWNSLYGSSMGRFGSDDQVVFRNVARWVTELEHDNFNHTLAINYRSHYTDQEQIVNLLNEDGSIDFAAEVSAQLEVPSYTTVDYQLTYHMLEDALALTFGINNLFDKEPPLSLRVSGSGHQVGWDPRYTDAYGRTFYLSASYEF